MERAALERIVSTLSLAERRNLLEKLAEEPVLSKAPLRPYPEEESPAARTRNQYESRNALVRAWYYLLGLLKGRPAGQVFEEARLERLGKGISKRDPDLYEWRERKLLYGFYTRAEGLREAARFFASALEAGFEQDKGVFYAFLGSLEIPAFHKKLEESLDAAAAAREFPQKASRAELQQAMLRNNSQVMNSLSVEERNAMYASARYLHSLSKFAAFPFGKILAMFVSAGAPEERNCPLILASVQLEALYSVLQSFASAPPPALLESLFIFLTDRQEGEDYPLDGELGAFVTKAEQAFGAIRAFNKQVPLLGLLRCAKQDLFLTAEPLTGGEDWFPVYRDYWKRRVEAAAEDFVKKRRRQELIDSFNTLLKGTSLKDLMSPPEDADSGAIPVKGSAALALILTFYQDVFVSVMNKYLDPIVTEGVFYRTENRTKFTENYSRLVNLEEDIRRFYIKVSPSGEYGMRYAKALEGKSSLLLKRRKGMGVSIEASAEAALIIDSARVICQGMIDILGGITGTNTGNGYDTLSKVPGPPDESPRFLAGLKGVIQKFTDLIKLIDDITELEEGT